MLRLRTRAAESGFSLVELMVTLVLFGLLTAIAVPVFITQSKAITVNSVRQDVHSLATSVKTSLQASPNASAFSIYTTNAPPAGLPSGTAPVRNTAQGSNKFKIVGPVQCKDDPTAANSTGSSAGYSVVGYNDGLSGYYYWYNSATGDYYSSDSWNSAAQSCTPDNSFKSK